MKSITEYIGNELLNESVLKSRANDPVTPFFNLSYRAGYGREFWLPVSKIEIESNSLFGEEADDGMCYCTLTFGSLCKTKQIPIQKKIKEKCSNNCGYTWMPTPELLAAIVDYFGFDKVTFDIDDENLKGVKWDKMGHGTDFYDKVKKTYDTIFSK